MTAVLVALHVLSCAFLVVVVLLQTGKGAEMGAVFGGSSQTVFGASGAGNFLTHLTAATAAVFMITSLSLTYLGGRRAASTVFDSGAPAEAPLAPAAPQVPPAPAAREAAPPPAAAPAPASSEPGAGAAAPQAQEPVAAAPAAGAPAPAPETGVEEDAPPPAHGSAEPPAPAGN